MNSIGILAAALFSEGKPAYKCVNRETNGSFKWCIKKGKACRENCEDLEIEAQTTDECNKRRPQ